MVINNKRFMYTFLIIGIISLTLGVSLAFFNYTRTGGANAIRVGRIAFNTTQEGNISLTNIFPMSTEEFEGGSLDPNNNVTINIMGDTTYPNGIEYLVTTEVVHVEINEKRIPLTLKVTTNSDLGTNDPDYFTNRGGNTSIHKVLSGGVIVPGQYLVVGYLAPGQTGIEGSLNISAYINSDNIAISDTYDGSESGTMGTTSDWVRNRTVFTTEEWNSFSTSEHALSFKVRVEANEGIWVSEPLSAYGVMQSNADTATLINFANPSSDTNGKGLYILPGTESDTHPIYYYRGAVDNNNVVFAGYCWQMVRTTDTGGIKMIYNGEPVVTGSGENITYDCGGTRPVGHIGEIETTTSISHSTGYYYADDYEIYSVSGNSVTYRLKSKTNQIRQIAISSSTDIGANIPTILANYPYTCKKTAAATTCTNTSFYKVTGRSSGVNAYVYTSTYRDAIGNGAFNSSSTSIARVGYMYNSSTAKTTSSFSMADKSLTVSTSSSYLIGDSLINNSDGTISLSGNVTEVAGSTWSTDYGNYTSKFVCLPGYYNSTTYVCSDTRTTNDVQAVGYITATTGTKITYLPVYKYGNNIDLDSGSTYKLVGDGSTQNTLQYIYNWNATTTSNCFANSTYYTNGNVSSCGYKSIDYSHYTCFNLSGKCSTYYYINGTTTSAAYRTPITGGKYVEIYDVTTDEDNILYDMLYAPNVNTTNSTIKGNIDTWYRDNLYTNYDSYIDDTVYCNDRTITSFGGWNPNGGSTTSSYELKFKEYTVSSDLSCINTTDKFSQANTSAQLTYKVGLMSSPEMNLLNNNNARKTAYYYWLSSPNSFYDNSVAGRIVVADGSFGNHKVNRTNGARPSVSLNTGIGYSQGTGAMNDPYVVDAPPVSGS